MDKLLNNLFLRNWAIYFTGSMLVAFFNYLFYPVLGRMLDTADFGEVQSSIAIFAQLAILFGFFSTVVVNITANVQDPNERMAVIYKLREIALKLVFVASIALILLSGYLKSFFQFSSIIPFILIALILPLSVLISFRNSYLQGQKRFKSSSITSLITSIGRLAIAALFVYLGLRAGGALGGILVAQIISYAFLVIRTPDFKIIRPKDDVHTLEQGRIKKELRYGLLVLFSSACVTFLYTSDVLVVKHYFDANLSGIYSGVAAVGTILYFALIPVTSVLLAHVGIEKAAENKKLLLTALGVVGAIGPVGIFLFAEFYGIIVTSLMGSKYLDFAWLLPLMGASMFLIAVLNVIFNYHLALRKFIIAIPAIISVASVILLSVLFHSNFEQVIINIIISTLIAFILLVILHAKTYINRSSSI